MRVFARLMMNVFRRLPRQIHHELFLQSGLALGVTGYEVSGKTGRFAGALRDQTIIQSYARDGVWSINIIAALNVALADGGTLVDVGANIGLVTVALAQKANVKVIAVEPDLENCSLLRANVGRNNVGDRVTVVNAACADGEGTLRFTRDAYNSGDHRISSAGEIEVPTLQLDTIVPSDTNRLAVKIDTQGAEPLVILGGLRTLERANLIVMEFWPWGMRRMGTDPEAIVDWLLKSGRTGYLLRHDEGVVGSPSIASTLVEKMNEMIQTGGEYEAADLVLN